MIEKDTAIVSAYAHLDAALDAMTRLDLEKGYDMAKYKIEMALEVLAASGVEVPIRKRRRFRKSM